MTANAIKYRFATDADVSLLAEWNHQLIQDEGHQNPMSLAELAERMHGWLTDDYKAVIFEYVASEHEAPSLAYALYRYDPGYVYIRHFFVVREYRASGVGRAAIRLLLNDILPKDIPKRLEVLVNNERGSAFWKAVGFREYSVIMESLPG